MVKRIFLIPSIQVKLEKPKVTTSGYPAESQTMYGYNIFIGKNRNY